MAAAATDLVRKKKSNFSTTLSSGINDSVATIPLSSSSGLPTDTAITLTIDRVDANAVSTPTLMERVTGVVGVNQLTTSTRGVEGTAQSHSAGAVVEDIWEAATWNDLCTAFLVNHSQTGHIKSGAQIDDTSADHQYVFAVSELAADRTITLPLLLSADTFVFADFIQTLQNKTLITPKINSAIFDYNGNELFKFSPVASAVNELTVRNAAANSAVGMDATGGDTNIDMELVPKGSGVMKAKTTVQLTAVGPTTDTSTGDGKTGFRVPKELAGMNLVAVAACVTTAGTTNTTDIQLRRVRAGSAVDMLSTKITIDSTEVDSSTAATPAVINTSNDDVAEADQIYVDIDAVHTTAAKGLFVHLTFAKP